MPPADAEKLLVESEVMKGQEKEKPLKPARSQAELLAVRQRWITIAIQTIALVLALLTCLRVYGIL